jgi:diacylglycerol kinase family enzyme
MADGKLNVYLADNMNRLSLAKLVLSTKDGSHIQSKHVRMIKTDKVTIKCDEEIESNIDGEVLKGNAFDIELIPKRIELYNDQRLIDKVLKEKIKIKNVL